jgi:hypothetical protein
MKAIVVGLFVFNIINFPLYRFLFRKFFADKEEFKEALYFYFRPDLFSLLKGELLEDLRAETKLRFFVLICATLLTAEILLMQEVLTN